MKIQVVPCVDMSFDIVLCFHAWDGSNEAIILATGLVDGDDIEAWLKHNNVRGRMMIEWL